MTRTERLLALITRFRRSRSPVAFAQLREELPEAWGGSKVAARRKFERDKRALRELGVVLRYDKRLCGYLLDSEAVRLRPIQLRPEHGMLLRQAAALIASDPRSPFAPEVLGAFARLASVGEPTDASSELAGDLIFHHPIRDQDGGTADRLGKLALATWRRLEISFLYRRFGGSRERAYHLQPWGTFAVRGRWFVIGHCTGREAERTFSIERMRELHVEGLPDGRAAFRAPKGFDLRAEATRRPWRFRCHAPLPVKLLVDAELAPHIARLVDGEITDQADGVHAIVSTSVTWAEGLLPALLEWVPRLRVVAPDELVVAWERPFHRLAARHGVGVVR